jgi:hypothetical protein
MRGIIERSARMIYREIESNFYLYQLTGNDKYSQACIATINSAIYFIANEFRVAYQTPIFSACLCGHFVPKLLLTESRKTLWRTIPGELRFLLR